MDHGNRCRADGKEIMGKSGSAFGSLETSYLTWTRCGKRFWGTNSGMMGGMGEGIDTIGTQAEV